MQPMFIKLVAFIKKLKNKNIIADYMNTNTF